MSLATALKNLMADLGSGQNKKTAVYDSDTFTTTGTTKTVTVPLKVIEAFFVVPYGTAAAANGQLTANNTFPLRSTVGSQSVTVTRAAGTDSGLGFFWIAFGQK